MTVQVGEVAPDFSLPSIDSIITLSEMRGKNVIIYFYPKDMTPGCTTEACDFQDSLEKLISSDTMVLGISPDSIESHRRFAAKHQLSFPLLSDETHEVAEKYGVWIEKNMYGKKYMGIDRSTFVIDPRGVVQKIFRKVKVAGHVDQVISFLDYDMI